MLIPEESTRIAMLQTGETDAADIGVDSAEDVQAAGMKTAPQPGRQATVNIMGAYDPRAKTLPTSDFRIREALNLAINREEIGKNLFPGLLAAPAPVLLSATQREMDTKYWAAQCAKVYRYDPVEAKRLLAEAGYADGFSITLYNITGVAGAAYLPKLAAVVQAQWTAIGIKGNLYTINDAGWSNLRRSGPNRGPKE